MFRKRDRDLDRELRGHIDEEADEQRESGLAPYEARFAAQRAFGNRTLAMEDTRAMWRFHAFEASIQDLRYGIRLLGRTPAFALFAIVSLALGIGATSAIFTLFDAIVMRDIPVPEPTRLVTASIVRSG